MKIALGTTSKNKIRLLSEVFNELALEVDFEPYVISSGVADQPLTSEETKLGSINRAIGALESSEGADYGLGLEVGYQQNQKGDYTFFCWATIIDSRGKQVSMSSEEFVLPEFHQQALKSGKYLIDYARDMSEEDAALIAKYREAVIKSAVKQVWDKQANTKT